MPRSIGLALGSGAARGLAHLGVLKVLEENHIFPQAISGTSIGAFIGALYASGVSLAQMQEVASINDWRNLARLIDPAIPTSGILNGKNVASFMAELLPVHTFEELQIPFSVVTTDIETGEHVIIKKGNLVDALRATIAFPGIFPPVRFGNRFLVDGGLCVPVPINQVRSLGADIVVGVCTIPEVQKKQTEAFLVEPKEPKLSTTGFRDRFNLEAVEKLFKTSSKNQLNKEPPPKNTSSDNRKTPGILKVFAQSIAIMENEINSLRLEKDHADLLIRPELNNITLLEFNRAQEAISAGEQAMRVLLPQLRSLIASN